MKNYLLILLASLLMASCNESNTGFGFSGGEASESMKFATEQSTSSEEDSQPEQEIEVLRTSNKDAAIPRKVIKTAQYRIRVSELEESAKRIEEMVAAHQGFISAQEVNSSTYELNSSLTIRVPADQFDTLLEALGGEADYVQYKRVEARDVTEEYVDIETRLQTKRDVRDRYIDILRNKAKTVEEVLLAEEQIRVIQEEIESKEGRLRFLKDRVSMSTIHLEIYQTIEYKEAPSAYKRNFWTDLKDSLGDGGELIRDLFLGLLSIWPLVILFMLLIWRGPRLWRRMRGSKK